METRYRRHFGRYEDWHFDPDCPDWPEANYFEEMRLAENEEICQKCSELKNRGSSDPNPTSKKS